MSTGIPIQQRRRLVGRVGITFVLLLALIGTSLSAQAVASDKNPSLQAGANAPNIVVFLADDMGYSDLGVFGSEISTPNIDSLASNGLRMTNFHTMASDAPTRAELLTGVDNHRAGFGATASGLHPTQVGQPGYETVLNDKVVTVASLLRASGYHTYHLCLLERQRRRCARPRRALCL